MSAPSSAPTLVRRPVRPALRPRWDEAGERVLAHRTGPLRLLGGPGTGKSTLLVHAVLRRLAGGVDPERILMLVGSRRAAATLREQITAGLAAADGAPRTVREPIVRTVHSYAFGLLRLHAARHGTPPPRLLAGPEQDVVVRELLAGELAGEVAGAGWPARLLACLPMPGFAAELRELLLRAAERGLGPAELEALGHREGFPEWAAAGRFFRRYEEVTLLRGAAGQGAPQATAAALDAAELVAAALDTLADDPELLAGERERVRHLLVDDAQDLDPQQARLVATVATTAETFVLAGDPDQTVLTFRGADPAALHGMGQPLLLTVDHRSTPELRLATGRLAARMPGASPARVRVGPAGQEPADEGVPATGLAVRVFASAAQEARWVADQLRRAHLVAGVAWSDMAVLVRSTGRTMPVLRRALLGAGVPMTVPADQLPVARQPGVLPLLLLLRCAAQPAVLDADACVALLTSALGGADPLTLRRLRRGLLKLAAAAGRGGDGAEKGSDELLVAALRAAAAGSADPLAALPPRDTAALRRVGELISTAAEATRRGHTVEQVLWQVWQASALARRWAAASARGGPIGAQADRDLDAVLALFDAAGRYTDRLPGADLAGFTDYLADQQIPGDTLAPRALQGDAVAVLTAHAARGREWRVVAVPAVQEGSWPDLRLRGTLLGAERLVDTVAGLSAGQHASLSAPLLAEERRLFYLACTRARQALLVSAVRGADEQPSRFLDELDPEPVDPADDGPRPVTQPPRALLLAELVGELRRAVCSVGGSAERRERAAAQLARLAEAGVPGAHPDEWYGLAALSTDAPLRDPGRPVPLSPSAVEKIIKCPLRWALERHGGEDGAALASVTGRLVHALVQACANGAPEQEVDAALRTAWAGVDAGAPWFDRHELARVRGMLSAFRQWLQASRAGGLTGVAVEREMELLLAPDDPDDEGGASSVLLRGQVDRLDVDAAGRPVIIDVKTGRNPVSREAAREHPQLAVYQLAAALGAFAEVLDGEPEPGGARLLYLSPRGKPGQAVELPQPPLDAAALEHWRAELRRCASDTSGPGFTARQGPDCDRCPVRASCPLTDSGRPVTDG